MDRQREVEDLVKADAHIAAGERRIAEQSKRIEQLRVHGYGTEEAEQFLALLNDTLRNWHNHREQIIRVIEAIDAGRI